MKKFFSLFVVALTATLAYGQQPNIADIEAAKYAKVLAMQQEKSGGTGANLTTVSGAPEQDCLGAILVCQPIYYQPNSYLGPGNVLNEITPASSCLASGEKNSVWYKIMVVNDGLLGFNITPNELTDDYDWAVYNMTNSSCGDIATNSLEVACNFSGVTFPTPVTGPNGGTDSTFIYGPDGLYHHEGPMIPVFAGQVYYILVNNFSSTQSGYSIDFGISTIELGKCSFMYGNVFLDANNNCQLNPTDPPLPQQVVYALPGPYYALSDSNGLYRIGIPQGVTGQYQLFTQPLSPALIQNCPASPSFLTVNVTNTDSLYPGNNFGYIGNPAIATPCPALTVSNESWGMFLSCCGGYRSVEICNNGNTAATNVVLDLEYLDNYIIPVDASWGYYNSGSIPVPYTQNGNHYIFNLPNLGVGACYNLYINETVTDSSFTGFIGNETCVLAHVTPDSPCLEPATGWDGSNVIINSQCNAQNVVFTLQNNGIYNMNSPLSYTVYNGQVAIDNGTFQLQAGQTTSYTYPANGDIYVMQADQSANNPTGIQPSAFVANCGDSTFVQTANFNNFSQGDQSDPYDMNCTVILNSYDPNDKQAVPSGISQQHFISSNDEIEYKIRFQNTGTGPAQKVVLIDTLDIAHLDLLSLHIGASNYAYSAELVGNGVLIFTFNNIQLPPASTDSLGSIGFITYTISQKWDNPISYTINNKAYIYFDNNPPIITNNVFHNVKDNFSTSVAEAIGKNGLGVIAYPNPTNSNITLLLNTLKTGQSYTLAIFNSAGMLVKEQNNIKQLGTTHNIATLATGLYTYRIVTTDGKTAAGRFVKE